MFVLTLLQAVIPFIIIVTTGLYIYYKYVIFTFWSKRRVPYPEPTFLIGNLRPFLSISAAEMFDNLYQQYKKHRFVGIYIYHVPSLLVIDPDLIRVILLKEFNSFHSRGVCCDGEVDPLMKNVICVPGDKWKNLHPRIKLAYSPGKVKQMLPLWEHGSNCLLKYLRAKAEYQTTFDVTETMIRYYADVITGSTFGISTTSLSEKGLVDNPFATHSESVLGIHTLWVSFFVFFPEFYSYFKVPVVSRAVRKFFFKLVEDLMQYRTANNVKSKDIFDNVMQLMKNSDVASDTAQNTDNKESAHIEYNLEDVVANAFTVYLAGHETTSLTTTYCLYELAMNPNIQDKTRQEVTSVLEKHGAITYDALGEMTYLDKVVSETMRKYPIGPSLVRICNEDIELPETDVRIPKGTRVLIPVAGIHWDPDIYPDPHKFDPERFSKENIADRPSYTYLPFGQGPRMCMGYKLAWTITKFTIATTLSKYRLRPVPETPNPIVLKPGRITLAPKSKILLAVEVL